MKNFLRSFFILTIAALSLAGAGHSAAAGPYDGDWSVVIYTQRGDCDSALRYTLRIAGGRVLSEAASYRAYGAVGPGGAITVTVAQGNRSASGSGQLTRAAGRGWWRTSTGQCSGRWTAERRPW
jgi:hypothetical protein